MMRRVWLPFGIIFSLLLGVTVGATGEDSSPRASCVVPGQRPTIQSALDDTNCNLVIVDAGTYDEILSITRTVSLLGNGSPIIRGNVGVRGAGVTLSIDGFHIQPYSDAIQRPLCTGLVVADGATASPDNLQINETTGAGPCLDARGDLIFADGFENGTTNRW